MSVAVAARETDLDRELLAMLGALVDRAPLFADLRARGEAEDLVQETMIVVARRMAGGAVEDPFAYATRVIQNLARRAHVRRRPEDSTPEDELAVLRAAADVADQVEQRFELAEVLEMVRGVTAAVRALPAEDVEIVRAELRRDDQRALARDLGVSRATFYRRKRRAVCGFVSAVAGGAGAQPCGDRLESLLAAAGGSGFAAAAHARTHAADCPGCAATLRHLTAARHGMALLAPLPALSVASPDVGERASTVLHAVTEWVRALAVRAPDPAAALPASKTAAAVAAACLGVGGGAYCAVDGMPTPVRDALGLHRPARATAHAAARPAARVAPPIAASRAAGAPAATPAPAATAMPRAAARHRAGAPATKFRTAARGGVAGREFGRRAARARAARAGASSQEFRRRARAAAPAPPASTEFRGAAAPATAVAATRPAAPAGRGASGEFGTSAPPPSGEFGG